MQSKIVIKIKNGQVNNTDSKSTQDNGKSGLVPYTEDSDNGSDKDTTSVSVNGEHATNGHAEDTRPITNGPEFISKQNTGPNHDGKFETVTSNNGKCNNSPLNKIPDARKLASPINVNTAIPTVPLFKKVRRLSGSQPAASIFQSPSLLNSSGNWSISDNKSQEPSLASSSSSATSFNSTADNWTVTSHDVDARVDRRPCLGWKVENSSLRRECDKNGSFNSELNADKKFQFTEVASTSKAPESTDNISDSKNVNTGVRCDKGTQSIIAAETEKSADDDKLCGNKEKELATTSCSEFKLPGSLHVLESDGSENSYEVEWVEKTKETIEQENLRNSREKTHQGKNWLSSLPHIDDF